MNMKPMKVTKTTKMMQTMKTVKPMKPTKAMKMTKPMKTTKPMQTKMTATQWKKRVDELFEGVDPVPYGRIPLTPEATGLSEDEIARAQGKTIIRHLGVREVHVPAGSAVTDIVFDFGGVLADWDMAAALAGRYSPELIACFIDNSVSGVWDAFRLTDRGWADESGIELASRHDPVYGQMLAHAYQRFDLTGIRETPGSHQLIEDLQALGYRCWGLSNWSPENFRWVYRNIRAIRMLDGFIVSGFVHVAKPEPEIYQLAVERFGLNPSKTVFVDDNQENIDAARAAGWHGIVRTSPQETIDELRKLGVPLPAVQGVETLS